MILILQNLKETKSLVPGCVEDRTVYQVCLTPMNMPVRLEQNRHLEIHNLEGPVKLQKGSKSW